MQIFVRGFISFTSVPASRLPVTGSQLPVTSYQLPKNFKNKRFAFPQERA